MIAPVTASEEARAQSLNLGVVRGVPGVAVERLGALAPSRSGVSARPPCRRPEL